MSGLEFLYLLEGLVQPPPTLQVPKDSLDIIERLNRQKRQSYGGWTVFQV